MIPTRGSFTVDIAYSTPMTRQIVVEVADSNGRGYGRGMVSVSGKGTTAVNVTMYQSPTRGKMLVLRVMIIIDGYGNNPVGYELDVQETFIEAGDAPAPADPVFVSTATRDSFSMFITVASTISCAILSYWIRN